MLHFLLATLLFTNLACHEPCKNGYGRAADKLCYPLADDPEAPCGDGMARTDEGVCVSVTDADDPYATAGATGGGSSGGTDGESSGGSSEGTGGETGGTDASGGTGGTTGGEIGGGEIGGAADVGTTTGGDASGAATLKGVLNTTDGVGFEEGDEVLIQAWTEDAIDPETGLPGEGTAPRATQFASAAVTAVSIHFEFIVTDVLEEGENIRLTAHLTDDPLDVEGAPMGVFPPDLAVWIRVLPGERTEDILIAIDNGGGSPGGGPIDTGLPHLMAGGRYGSAQ